MPASLSAFARVDRHVADRRAALEVGVLGHEPRAVEDVLEVALGQALALGDHAEAVRPGASAARACSRIWSGVIIACIGVSASAKRDWAQKPQSSAQPPDLALTSEHMSVESPKRSRRTCQARSTSASISAWSSISPEPSASSGDERRHRGPPVGRPRTELGRLAALPARRALLRERPHALAEVLRAEAGLAQLDQLLLDLGGSGRRAQRADARACCPPATAARWPRSRRPARARAPRARSGSTHLVHEAHLAGRARRPRSRRRRRARRCWPRRRRR